MDFLRTEKYSLLGPFVGHWGQNRPAYSVIAIETLARDLGGVCTVIIMNILTMGQKVVKCDL